MTVEWRGEFYRRKKGRGAPNWRNRRTGSVVGTVKVKKRKGKTNQAILFDGKNFKGVEETGKHFFFSDPRPSASAKTKYEARVRANKAGSKKSRKSHTRRVK